jgi:hypothetical protein
MRRRHMPQRWGLEREGVVFLPGGAGGGGGGGRALAPAFSFQAPPAEPAAGARKGAGRR